MMVSLVCIVLITSRFVDSLCLCFVGLIVLGSARYAVVVLVVWLVLDVVLFDLMVCCFEFCCLLNLISGWVLRLLIVCAVFCWFNSITLLCLIAACTLLYVLGLVAWRLWFADYIVGVCC